MFFEHGLIVKLVYGHFVVAFGGSSVLVGDTVNITQGPFVGLRARFASAEGQRALVVLELQGRQLDVELDLDWIVITATPKRRTSGVEGPGAQERNSA